MTSKVKETYGIYFNEQKRVIISKNLTRECEITHWLKSFEYFT